MKPSEVIVVFMNIAESAKLGSGPTIIEVFFNDNEKAQSLAEEIRRKVSKRWGFDKKKLSDSDKMILQGVVEIITLDKAIERIQDEIYEMYSSLDSDY